MSILIKSKIVFGIVQVYFSISNFEYSMYDMEKMPDRGKGNF